MRKLILLCALVFATVLLISASPVMAQYVSWVGPNGSDNNACTQTSPCQTFEGAISKGSTEINCLDDGDYGGFFITASIIIDWGGHVGTVAQPTNNLPAIRLSGTGLNVTLRHLSIEGFGTGQIGIGTASGVSNVNLVIDNCVIDGFANSGGGSAAGVGIYLTPGGTRSSLTVTNTVISGSNGTSGDGILVQPSGGAIVSVSLVGDLIQNNTDGVFFNASGGVIAGVVVDSRVIENPFIGIVAGGTDYITIDSSTIADNLVVGILSQNSGANIAVTNTTITGNGLGVSGSAVTSFKNNRLFLNGTDGSFGGTQSSQ